ncbi:MAG TPA: GGDEF domain-containing protein [Pyrinomonadaceae bacterium]|nr:GGDEF domain-containing protein [Pyrinomonadaceae bacterium]
MAITEFLARRTKTFHLTTGLLLVILLGALDYLNGPDVSFLIFYTAPVLLAAWYVGRWAGRLMCAATGVSWFAVAVATTDHFTHPLIAFWNVAVRLGFMLILARVASALKASLEQERESARTDYLTGATNGRFFAELAEAEINRARRHGHPFTVAYMDVDNFKLVNDRLGHSAGDRLLRSVADTLRRQVRAIDVVARLGGDEFALLLPETDADAARTAVARVRRSLLASARRGGWPVTFSIGVVTFDEPPASVDELLRAADALMYEAKRLGKNSVRHAAGGSDRPAHAA